MLGVVLPSIVAPLVHHLPLSRPPVCAPPILSAQTGGCTKVCRPPPFPRSPRFLAPFAQAAPLAWPPPLRPPFVARTVRPAPSRPAPCPALPCPALPFARMPGRRTDSAPPLLSVRGQQSLPPRLHPALPTSSTPFARTLGPGRPERPPSLSMREQAPPPRLLPLLRLTRHPPRARAFPHPLCKCRGRGRGDSAHLPLLFTPPPGLRHPCSPVYDAPRLARPPLLLHTCRGGTRDSASPPPVHGQSPSPGLRPSPVSHHARTTSTSFARIPEAQEGWGCAQWEGHAEGVTRQGRAARKGSTREGATRQGGPHARGLHAKGPRARGGPHARGPHAKGPHARGGPPARGQRGKGPGARGGPHARGPRVKGPRARGGPHARGPRTRGGARNNVRCNPGSKRRRCEGCANRARRNPGEGCCARAERGCENEAEGSGVLPGAGYNQAGGRRMNERRRAPFPHPRAQ